MQRKYAPWIAGLFLIAAISDLLAGISEGKKYELLASLGYFAFALAYLLEWLRLRVDGQTPLMMQSKRAAVLSLAGAALLGIAFGLRRNWF
ncbi:hypothetical protein ASD15_21165 [Massilia sp. Root351]|jgi:hypothetical protein|uniref:hypothetical protein n=1 Tax=Massilia sp. Root351 TaxID=1736522 RepID=UPI00070A6B48|nr:hypothetical protein [Massilia sp. Root351]KQV79168.1 hypothetical protein ASD15_21165 [Massilia sp. Root351]